LPYFQEQSLYFEAMFQAVSEEPWVTGITIGIRENFKLVCAKEQKHHEYDC